jgi:hypothetical protein
VLAFEDGSAPEIIDHGMTGSLVEDEDEMAAAAAKAGEMDAEECRRAAERFGPVRAATDYGQIYRHVLARSTAS